MVLEVAILLVKSGHEADFEKDFHKAEKLIVISPGYIEHELRKCLEVSNKYILLVKWKDLESHTQGFRGSEEYLEWKSLLHHYYDPFPVVEHYVSV